MLTLTSAALALRPDVERLSAQADAAGIMAVHAKNRARRYSWERVGRDSAAPYQRLLPH